MTVVRADILGFCAGVRRAVSAAIQALDENDKNSQMLSVQECADKASAAPARVFTLGPLIHNPVALSELAARGLQVLEPEDISTLTKADTVLIRAHGVPPATVAALRDTGCTVINATCPLVTQSQKRAASFAERGYTIIFAGDKNHGEVIGIQGYAESAAREHGLECRFVLVRTAEEAENLFTSGGVLSECNGLTSNTSAEEDAVGNAGANVVLLSQTTFSIREFERISAVVRSRVPGVTICSSICPATHERQDAVKRLCAAVDGVLVIGGKNSANTMRLYATAKKLCAHAALIEHADEIPAAFFTLLKVGITAGASTPDSVIAAVEARLNESSVTAV